LSVVFVLATPLLVRAQQAMPMVGAVVGGSSSRGTSIVAEPFIHYMKELGWEEGRNDSVHFLWAEGHSDRLPGLISELITRRVNVMVVLGNAALEAAHRAPTSIPIVGLTDDMVKNGFAASMARPGGNIAARFSGSFRFSHYGGDPLPDKSHYVIENVAIVGIDQMVLVGGGAVPQTSSHVKTSITPGTTNAALRPCGRSAHGRGATAAPLDVPVSKLTHPLCSELAR
jgi:hypothetical protein